MSSLKVINLQHPSASSASFVLASDGTSAAQLSSVNDGPLSGFRNRIINGNFDIWQRGTSFTATGFGADRWAQVLNGTTSTFSRQTFTLGQTDVPGNPTYHARFAVTSSAGAGNYAYVEHKIEDVRTLAGSDVQVSFYAKADAARPIAVELAQAFGSGGSPSTAVTGIGVYKTTLGLGWQRVSFTASIPSISTKTIGTNNDSYLTLIIWFDAGSSFNSRTLSLGQQSGTFDIAQVQLEPGTVATTFERRPIGTELALCQRYYQTGSSRLAGYSPTTVANATNVFWKQTMRATPTLTYGSTSAVNVSVYDIRTASTDGAEWYAVVTSTGGFIWSGTYTASAEL